MRKDSGRRRARRRRILEQSIGSRRSLTARRVATRSKHALEIRLGSDRTTWGILSMSFMPSEVVESLESMRAVSRRPRPDDRIAYEVEASTHLELDDPIRTRESLSGRIGNALDRVDAADIDAALFEAPEAWFNTFLTLSTGTWVLTRDVVRRLALLRSNVWIDAT